MRRDGGNFFAPHTFVKALIKRITYPKLACFVNFGQPRTTSDFSACAINVSIYNLSKLQNEKNLRYSVTCHGGDLIIDGETIPLRKLNFSSEHIRFAKDVLHYNIPFFQGFTLLSLREYSSVLRNITIRVIAHGDSSPAICSNYILEPIRAGSGFYVEFQLKEVRENYYLMDQVGDENLSDMERIAWTNKQFMAVCGQSKLDNEFFKNLSRPIL
ncbi:MAG: hypothetical protein ABWZ25_10025 [Chitinophagaceae bacterium]